MKHVTNNIYALVMASRMEYEPDSPLSYMEEGELSSGRSSPGTIRENASECSTQTDDCETVTTMTVEVDNDQTPPPNQPRPLEIARRIAEHTVQPKTSDLRKNLESFRTRTNRINQANQVNQTDIPEPDNNTKPSYQHNRPVKNHVHQQNQTNTENARLHVKNASPPMPMHPRPVRPPPPDNEDITTNSYKMQQRAQQRWFKRNSAHIRPNNLRFPYAVTTRSNNKKSFFHQSTNEKSPNSSISETIWFTDMDSRNLNNPHNSEYNPLLSYKKWADMPFDSKMYNFVKAPLHKIESLNTSHLYHRKTRTL